MGKVNDVVPVMHFRLIPLVAADQAVYTMGHKNSMALCRMLW